MNDIDLLNHFKLDNPFKHLITIEEGESICENRECSSQHKGRMLTCRTILQCYEILNTYTGHRTYFKSNKEYDRGNSITEYPDYKVSNKYQIKCNDTCIWSLNEGYLKQRKYFELLLVLKNGEFSKLVNNRYSNILVDLWKNLPQEELFKNIILALISIKDSK